MEERTVENLTLVDIDKLVPYARNARTHSEAQLAQLRASIRAFGFNNPVLIDENYGIIAGHGRVEAARREGMKKVPCVLIDHMTEAEKRAHIITDNKTALNAGWDEELLKIELGDLAEMKFDLTLTGFDEDELKLILDFDKDEPQVSEDEFEEQLPEEPITQVGDIYQLGRHRLMCGDSTDTETVAKLMAGAKADLYLTDPPYNVDYEGKTKDALKIQNDKMDNDVFRQFLRDAFAAADAAMKCGAVFYIWHADSEGYNFRGACFDIGWQVRQCLIWNKNSMVMGRQDYHWKHEPCLYGWKEGAGHLWASDRKQTTILNFDRPTASKEHPTMKPVLLFDYQIKNNTKAEDIVLDSFGGSGTTLIACEQNGRTAYLMELDPKYCDVIVDRYIKLKGSADEVVLIRDGAKQAYK